MVFLRSTRSSAALCGKASPGSSDGLARAVLFRAAVLDTSKVGRNAVPSKSAVGFSFSSSSSSASSSAGAAQKPPDDEAFPWPVLLSSD